jgi:FixJ family two-component response regulator
MNVLIISRVGNIGLYVEAMIRGAFDFITPNIPPRTFVQVLKSGRRRSPAANE